MSGGYITPPSGELGELQQRFREVERRLNELERPDGTQVFGTVRQLRALIEDLAAQVNALASSGVVWEGPVSTTAGGVTASGEGSFTAGLRSTGAAALDVSTLSGSRQSTWQHISTGRFGYAPSTLAEKRNLRPVPFSAAAVLEIAPRVFHYRGQLDIRDNPDNPEYNPEYQVPDEVGVIAEELIAAGLELFVVRGEDGAPRGVHYDLFGVVAALLVGRDHEARIVELERRLTSSEAV